MKYTHLELLLAVFVIVIVTTAAIDESDAIEEYDAEYNCNDYSLSFIYTGGTQGDIKVVWSAYGIDDDGVRVFINIVGDEPSKENNWKVRFDPADVQKCRFVYVTQSITTALGDHDDMTIKVNVITPPPEGGFFEVRFYDGYSGSIISISSVYGDKVHNVGENFIELPGTPVREGYSFIGWFLPTKNQDVFVPFDPKKPVESDLDVFAKWTADKPVPGPLPNEVVKSLDVSGEYRTAYKVGDHLDTSGLKITACFEDGSIRDVTSLCDFKPTTFNHLGDITVTALYGGVSVYFDVTVSETGYSDNGSIGNAIYLLAILLIVVILLIAYVIYRQRRSR